MAGVKDDPAPGTVGAGMPRPAEPETPALGLPELTAAVASIAAKLETIILATPLTPADLAEGETSLVLVMREKTGLAIKRVTVDANGFLKV